jgi:hypothetical protein
MAEGIVHLILLKSWNIDQKLGVEREKSKKSPNQLSWAFHIDIRL